MGLESSPQHIDDLDEDWPLAGDPHTEGDDHIRNLKAVLKIVFPGTGGNGFAIPITATEAELNFVGGATSNIQDQIDALDTALVGVLMAPSGTKMAFFQATAPTGWTQDPSNDDAILRVVDGLGGGTGGTLAVSTAHTHDFTDDGHSLTAAENGPHTHGGVPEEIGDTDRGTNGSLFSLDGAGSTDSSGSGDAHAHSGTTDAGLVPKYIDIIICSKDA